MKKIIYSLLFLIASKAVLGQSVTISPSETTNQSNSGGENINVIANSNSMGIYGRRFNGTFAAKTPVLNGDELLRVSAGGFWSSTNQSQNASIKFNATENWGAGSGSKISFTTTPNAGVSQIERMVINHNGNIGIGATSPLSPLQVNHNGNSSLLTPHLRLKQTDDAYSSSIRMENSTGSRYFSQLFYLWSPTASNNTYGLYYGTDNLLAIKGDGRMGINISNPSDLLHLTPISNTGDVYTRISSTTGLTGLRLQNNAGDWSMYTNEFSKLFFGYSTDNFSSTAQVLVLEPNATEYNFIPSATNQVYLGTSGNRWREIWSQNPLNTSSDRRLKKNIGEIKYGLEEIMKLEAVSYNWKNNNDSKLQLGFIAQDVEKIVPEIVSKSGISDEEFAKLEQKGETISDTYGMQYTGLIPVLVKAVQEQQRIIEAKSKKIIQLEQKLQKMENLEARLSSIESFFEGKTTVQGLKTEK